MCPTDKQQAYELHPKTLPGAPASATDPSLTRRSIIRSGREAAGPLPLLNDPVHEPAMLPGAEFNYNAEAKRALRSIGTIGG